MISYEELCQTLDQFNNRQKNAAEMAALEQADESGDFEQMQPGFLGAEDITEDAGTELSADAMRSVPTSVDVNEEASQDAEAATAAPETDTAVASEQIPAEEMTAQPSEDTQEIDVDDVEIEDK